MSILYPQEMLKTARRVLVGPGCIADWMLVSGWKPEARLTIALSNLELFPEVSGELGTPIQNYMEL